MKPSSCPHRSTHSLHRAGQRLVGASLAGGLLVLVACGTPAAQPPASTPSITTSAVAPTAGVQFTPQAVPTAALVTSPNAPFPSVARIPASEAKRFYDAGAALFIDTRAESDYAAGHITGAILSSVPDLEARLKSLPPGSLAIFY